MSMTEKEIHGFFESHNEEFLKFERIPEAERRHERSDLCGMLLLAERFPGTHDMVAGAEHDEIYLEAHADGDEWPLSEDDVIYLTRCGVRWDDDNNSFCMFV
jgi:hypothetical protein